MGDIGRGDGVQPTANVKVHRLWTEQQIAEVETRIKRLEIDAEEILRGRLKGIEAEILMLKRKAAMLYAKSDNLDKFGVEDIVDVEGITVKQLENKGAKNG